MQRYRVNLPLLIGLVVGAAVVLGGSYGLYRFQKSRNASRLLEREEVAQQEGDLQESAKLLIQYLGLRPNDEEAMVRLSETLIDIAEAPKSEPIDIQRAIQQTETTVRNYPDRGELRRRLVDLYMAPRVRGLKSALDHISQLLNRNPGDPELQAMQSECFFAAASPKAIDHAFRLVGYDAASEEFDAESATAPNEPVVYLRLAQSLRRDRSEPDLADRVIDRMIEVNPDNGEAYLMRGQYAEMYDQGDESTEAEADIRKALELDPDDARIIAANARLAAKNEDFEEAERLLEEGIEKHPTNPMLYLTLSQVRAGAEDLEGSIAACESGIDAVPEDQLASLLVQKVQLQVRSDDPSVARETIKQMRDARAVQEAFPEYFEARLLMADNKWFEAAEVFDKYEAFMSTRNPMLGLELNVMLGLCREKLGQEELALAAYERALRLDSDNTMADLGRQRMLATIGGGRRGGEGVSIYSALAMELAKPENEQDWEAFDRLAQDYISRMQLGDAMLEVLRGEVMMRRKKYPEARKLLLSAYEMDKENLGVRRAAVKLFAADPDQGPVKALKLLDKVVEDFGDMPILRLERADLLTVINPDDLTQKLFALAEGIDDWSVAERVQLWRGLADKFARLGDTESRAAALARIAELAPGDLATLVERFELARDAGDEAGMKAAQDAILKVVGSKEDPTWLFTEAQRLLYRWRAAGGEGDGRDRADELVDRALSARGEWHELHNLKAEIALTRRDIRGALASYDRGADLGRQDPRARYQYIKLLMARGRFADALTQLEEIGRDGRLRLLGREYAECLLRVGRPSEAVIAAREYSELAPNSAPVQLWTGRFLSRASSSPGLVEGEGERAAADRKARQEELVADAGEAFTKAVEGDPRSAEAWLALVGYYAATGDLVKADDTIREAQLVLEEDQTQLLFARCYEIVGRGIDAEALYKQAMDQAGEEDQTRVARLMAQFYLGPPYRRPDAIEKATPLINQVLRDVAEGVVPPEDPSARWARSTAARLLARGGTYQELRDAERLLSSNSQDGVLPLEDRLLMAEILAPRPEPVSRLKAARLLEEINANQRLAKKSQLDLGKLYYALGEWRKCREQMMRVIAENPDDTEPRLAYLEMLLKRGGPTDIDEAVRQVKRLQEEAPNELATRDMLARVAYEKGRKREASQAILSMLPRSAGQLKAEQLPLVRQVAARLTSFEDYERAQKVYELAAQLGGVGDKLALARFVGEHVDAQQGLEAVEVLRTDAGAAQAVRTGLLIIRAVDDEQADVAAMFARVQGWLDRALREDPELISLKMQQAEFYDLQRDYEKAGKIYRELLERPDLQGVGRAVVLNNLAYLLALAEEDESSMSEAERYTAEAVDLLGPGSEILDTRAVIAIADERYQDAIADLKLAVVDAPTASKYFHLAAAYAGAGQAQLAAEAWAEALERGLTRESLSRLERDQFDQVKQQVESGGITSVVR